jgi:hypothetical protein
MNSHASKAPARAAVPAITPDKPLSERNRVDSSISFLMAFISSCVLGSFFMFESALWCKVKKKVEGGTSCAKKQVKFFK